MKISIAPHIGLLLLLSSFAAFPAAASDWQRVSDDEKVHVEIDVATLAHDGKVVKAWVRETHYKPKQAVPGDFYFKSAKSLAQFQCADRTITYLFRGYYAEDGSEIKAIDSTTDLCKVNFLIPDSREERQLTFACNYKHLAKKSGKSAPAKKALPPPAEMQAPDKPVVKDGQKGTSPAKIAGKDDKMPVESKPRIASKAQPVAPMKTSSASQAKTPVEK